jgi:hypothetical protein
MHIRGGKRKAPRSRGFSYSESAVAVFEGQ